MTDIYLHFLFAMLPAAAARCLMSCLSSRTAGCPVLSSRTQHAKLDEESIIWLDEESIRLLHARKTWHHAVCILYTLYIDIRICICIQ